MTHSSEYFMASDVLISECNQSFGLSNGKMDKISKILSDII